MSRPRGSHPRRLATFLLVGVFLGALAWTALPAPAEAQNISLGLRVYKEKAICALCHGWAGNGEGEMDNPGPSIRVAVLDRAGLVETIRCGRPETTMPRFSRRAYTDDPATSCYGVTEEDMGNMLPNPPPNFLSDREIEAVADYVMAWILGRDDDPTLEECVFYFGAGHDACRRYE